MSGIPDRLRVQPAQRMGVPDALLQEPALADFAIRRRLRERVEMAREPPKARGAIEPGVENDIVTLSAEVPGLDDKRLAGVLAWWVPGSRDVISGFAVEPLEDDSDDAILEAVRLVLEKYPFVGAGSGPCAVRLTGLLRTQAEREMGEFDAWYVRRSGRQPDRHTRVIPGRVAICWPDHAGCRVR